MERDRLAQEIAHVFAARSEDAAAVYLFGSVARGEGRADSDVDVAVLYGLACWHAVENKHKLGA